MPKLYHLVPLDEEQNGLAKMGVFRDETSLLSRAATKIQRHWAWLAHAFLLSTSITLLSLSICEKAVSKDEAVLLNKISTYSPLFPAVKYEAVRYKGLGPITGNTSFVGYGPEVDEAWDYIANDIGDIMITENERMKLGLSPDSLPIQHPETGEWGYRAGVEVFHQLHCLNLLRQAIYKDYYGRKEIGGDVGNAASPEDLHGHLDHCIEALRQNLMCQSDVSVFTFKKFPELFDSGITDDWPDFDINHQCRNFEAIRKWNNDHVVAWDHNA